MPRRKRLQNECEIPGRVGLKYGVDFLARPGSLRQHPGLQ